MKLVATIDGRGELLFFLVKEDIVERFVDEKADEGYLVSVVSNAESDDTKVCFHIEEEVYEIEE